MDSETKRERSRTRWTANIDKIFVDLIVKQIQLRNRPDNVFDKKTWARICDEFNTQSGLCFNTNQLRKHHDVLRIRYNNIKFAIDQNNFSLDDSCTIGFDLWESFGVQTRPEPVKVKECHIFQQLCIMFADNGVGGKYAQSSHYEDLENKSNEANMDVLASCNSVETPCSEAPSSTRFCEDNMAPAENRVKPWTKFKRKRSSNTHHSSELSVKEYELQDSMAEALLDMIASSELTAIGETIRGEGKFSITKCIRALDDIQGMNQAQYFTGLDLLESSSFREAFLSLNSNEERLVWLQHKCSVM